MKKLRNIMSRAAKYRSAIVPVCVMALVVAMTIIPDMAHAAGAGDPILDDVYTQLRAWTEGSVGKVITLAFVLVGIVAGVARQSMMAFAIGIGAGLGIYNAPTVIETVFSAVL